MSLQERTLVIPALAAHCMTAGIAISINKTCGDAILPCARGLEEWCEHLYSWQRTFVTKMKDDVKLLGCPC